MQNKIRTILLITLASLVTFALAYATYALFHHLVSRLLAGSIGHPLPPAMTRPVFGLVMLVCAVLIERSRLPDLAKAVLEMIPAGTLMLAASLGLYQYPMASLGLQILILVANLLIFLWRRKPWYYYYALGLTAVIIFVYQ